MASSREPGLFTAFRDSLVTKQVVSSTMGAAPAPIAEHPTPNRWRPSLVLQAHLGRGLAFLGMASDRILRMTMTAQQIGG
ncbi:hypothetical protein An08g05120 [Aspergillus niger]|uniref:Uncharacterized protein n=2 Tax=Aspergillus niger TaxID=5061 RepID=A2QR83_ASPNC|nr:hypothetical protein An08g05120 [Aspergillus niger]CAK45484.1 hypothetical protein An08g05120 [Aspergillus niger]